MNVLTTVLSTSEADVVSVGLTSPHIFPLFSSVPLPLGVGNTSEGERLGIIRGFGPPDYQSGQSSQRLGLSVCL